MSKTIEDDSLIGANPEILGSAIDDELVMMNVETGDYYGLDSIATEIWQKLENPIRFSKLVDSLIDEYEVEKDQCTNDVKALLQSMIKADLVQIQ